MSRLSNKVAIVTGASKGIGAAIATALGTAGARVAVLLDDWQRAAGAGVRKSWEFAYVHGCSGQKEKARAELKNLEAENRKQSIDPASWAFVSLGVGDNDVALGWLEKAYAQHSNGLTSLKVEPAYDPLRSDPRFQQLLQRVGLAP